MAVDAIALTEQSRLAVHQVLHRRKDEAGALLPILHDIQDELGFILGDVVSDIAAALNLSRAEVHGVITYYHHFRTSPPGRNVVQICRAEACQAMGAEALFAHAEEHLACKAHHTTEDGSVTLEAAYCLGLCASSPSISINGEVHARMTPIKFDRLMAEAREQA